MAIQFLPYALAALGGYRGYKGAKESGASGLGRILGAAAGAYSGYSLGSTGIGAFGSPATQAQFAATKTGPLNFLNNPLFGGTGQPGINPKNLGVDRFGNMVANPNYIDPSEGGSLSDILFRKKLEGGGYGDVSAGKLSLMAAGLPLVGEMFKGPQDVYTPGYNMNYLELKKNRPKYSYIDPATGQEKEYDQGYSPEEAGIGQERMGPYSVYKDRFNTGGLAQIKKFNEGGVNYLPSKVSHDEDDANNYVRATGYVEDGAGVGNKDEDTMLAQLADGEFVTRADGVLGAGIIAGGNPNSMKDMREKGAQYFYEQQKRYKRVFDLLKDRNGNSKQKTN